MTYSNSSLKLWAVSKCAIELIPVKIYKEVLVFLVAKTLKDKKSRPKASKGVFTIADTI